MPLENARSRPLDEPLDVGDIRNSLKSLMWRNMGVRREAEGLREALDNVRHWCRYVLDLQLTTPAAWELQNMLTIAPLMIRAALDRQESRGCHVRTDFPSVENAQWNRHITFRRDEP